MKRECYLPIANIQNNRNSTRFHTKFAIQAHQTHKLKQKRSLRKLNLLVRYYVQCYLLLKIINTVTNIKNHKHSD